MLLSLLLQPLFPAPAQATHSTALPSSAAGLGDPRELEAFLDGVLSRQLSANHIPGASVSVVRDGRLFFAKGYGFADLQAGTPVNAQSTLFRIGSVSKPFTATAVLRLAEQGKLNLHADINTYLKEFRIPATYPEPITLAHLLTHTSGFEANNTGLLQARTTSDLEPLGQLLAEHIPARVRPPGELTAYSNYGYALAGYIVQQVSGMPFEQYVERSIFQPLDMRSSTFRQPLPANLSANLSQGYTVSNGMYRSGSFTVIPVPPAGAMSATATDMANFMIAQLRDGQFGTQRILQEATVKAMHTQQFTNDPRVPGLTYGFEEHDMNGQRVLVHLGGIGSFYSLLALMPEQNVGVFVSYNSAGGGVDFLSLPFLRAFMDHYFSVANEPLPPPPTGSAERISQISGTYWATGRSYTTWEKLIDSFIWGITVTGSGDGRLVLSWRLGPLAAGFFGSPVTFVEVAPWVFHQINGSETVVFRADPGGMLMFRGSFPVNAFTKVAWYRTAIFSFWLAVVCVLVFLSVLLWWPAGFLRRLLRRRPSGPNSAQHADDSSRGIVPLLASGLACALSALNVVIMILLPLFLFGQISQPDYYYGVPPLLTGIFILALVAAVCTAGVIVFAIPVWWRRFWSVRRRVHYSLLALAALAFTWQLVYWNLLGFRA